MNKYSERKNTSCTGVTGGVGVRVSKISEHKDPPPPRKKWTVNLEKTI